MLFPENKAALSSFVFEILAACKASQGSRRSFYRNSYNWYMTGSNTSTNSKYNKIKPTVDRRTSFLYAPDQTRFWATLPRDEDEVAQFGRIESVTDAIEDHWHDSGLDLLFNEGVRWAQVNGSMIGGIFAQPRAPAQNGERLNSITSYLIHPEHFGVLEEGVNDLHRQEALCMTTLLTEFEIRRKYARHPRFREFSFAQDSEQRAASGLVFVSSASANSAQGFGSPSGGQQFYYDPQNGAIPRYSVHCLHAWDDSRNDWRVFECSDSSIIYDTPIEAVGVSGTLPYFQICPQPLPFYFWGYSLVDGLAQVQELYTTRMEQTNRLWEKILKPPKIIFGATQLPEDREGALNRAGGVNYFGQRAMTDMQELQPQLPDSALTMLEEVSNIFIDLSGMRHSMLGRNEPGNRTEGMLANTLRVGASEVLRMALQIERQVEEAATTLWQYIRRYTKTKLPELDSATGKPTGAFFLPADFPEDVKIKVDGHSSSPIYVQDHAQMVQSLFRMGAIDQKTAVRLIHPPQQGYIESKLEQIQFAKTVAEALAKMQQAQKRGGAGAPGGE